MAQKLEICVPDIGDFDEVEVVEILVAKGDRVEFEDPLVTVESDKATMEIPSTVAGVVAEVRVAEGDRVSEGSVLVVVDAGVESATGVGVGEVEPTNATGDAPLEPESVVEGSESPRAKSAAEPVAAEPTDESQMAGRYLGREMSPASANPVPDRSGLPHASPLVRRYARELGVSLVRAEGTGSHGRILIDDLKRHVRQRLENDSATVGSESSISGVSAIPAMPAVDHGAFGPVREQKLTRIQKVSGPALLRSWLNVPHVTQHDEADVTRLEWFRRDRREAASERGLKLSPLLFVMKAVVIALDEYPTLRSSLSSEGDRLIVKEYFHLGIAVDTDEGLVVPVIRDVDQKGIFELAAELDATAARARARKLGPDDLRGACFTISSLGGIGGTAFTPIVNAPEVAILGLSKTRVQPVWRGPSPIDLISPGRESAAVGQIDSPEPGHFEPRLMLPFSLSYDHRAIDGALAARFTSRLSRLLSDPIQLLL